MTAATSCRKPFPPDPLSPASQFAAAWDQPPALQFANRATDRYVFPLLFDRICAKHGIEHRLTKPITSLIDGSEQYRRAGDRLPAQQRLYGALKSRVFNVDQRGDCFPRQFTDALDRAARSRAGIESFLWAARHWLECSAEGLIVTGLCSPSK